MSTPAPQTRFSLMARLTDAGDHQAWTEFTAIYEPLLLRLLGRYGLQDCDARDVCQQVLTAVAQDISRWQPDGKDQSFRRWLFRIARLRVLKFLTREQKRLRGTGGNTAQMQLEQAREPRPDVSTEFELEYRQQLIACAAEQIRGEFRDNTWTAFQLSFIDGLPIAEVAQQLEMTPGSIYVARSRIVARLKRRVQQKLDDESSD